MTLSKNENAEEDKPEGENSLCRNCGQQVPELYCTYCGQSLKEIRVSFLSLVGEFVSEIFNYDSKFIRSIIPLFFRPGSLTAAFLAGKRASFVTPLRLYIVSSLLFFLTLAFVSGGTEEFETVDDEVAANVAGEEEVQSVSKSGVTFTEARFEPESWYGRYLNERLDQQDRKLQKMGQEAFMRELVREFLSSLPSALFLLMPLFALLLKLFYWRSDPLYIDHLIFAFHYHAYIYVLTSLFLFVGSQTDVLLALCILCGFFAYPTYLLLALRRVYAQKWHWTLIKFFIITITYVVFLVLFLPLFFLFSALFLV